MRKWKLAADEPTGRRLLCRRIRSVVVMKNPEIIFGNIIKGDAFLYLGNLFG